MNEPPLPLTACHLFAARPSSPVSTAACCVGQRRDRTGAGGSAAARAERLAACLDDPRSPDQVAHSLADMIGFRMKMIAAGYEDGNDANRLRAIPCSRRPRMRSHRVVISPPSRGSVAWRTSPAFANSTAIGRALSRSLLFLFRQAQRRILLDIADTFDPVQATAGDVEQHRRQQLQLRLGRHALAQIACLGAIAGDRLAQPVEPEGLQREPDLERPKATTEVDAILAEPRIAAGEARSAAAR